eukprot:354946-Chlamydomonas_euryale.AAC.6
MRLAARGRVADTVRAVRSLRPSAFRRCAHSRSSRCVPKLGRQAGRRAALEYCHSAHAHWVHNASTSERIRAGSRQWEDSPVHTCTAVACASARLHAPRAAVRATRRNDAARRGDAPRRTQR